MALANGLDKFWESLSCCSYRGDQHTDVIIKEHDISAILKKVTVSVENGNWFSFNPDKGRGQKSMMSPLLAIGSSHYHHRACDCVIVIYRNDKLLVIYIDLKSGNPTGYADQFRSTRQFLRYALGLLEEFHKKKFVVQEHYVILYGGKKHFIHKTTTKINRKKNAKSQPDNPFKLEVTNDAKLFIRQIIP